MAVHFNETGDHYEVAAAAARNFPEGDWVIALWTRVDNNVGNGYKYTLSTGSFKSAGSIQLVLREADLSSGPNKWDGSIRDNSDNSVSFKSTSAPGADGKDRLLVLQRNASLARIEFWFCEYGRDPVLEATADTPSLGASTGPANLWIGGRADGTASRFFGGVLGEVFRGEFALSEEQIKALGMGLPAWALGRALTFYHPLSDARSVQCDLFGRNDATATNPGTTSAHVPLATAPGSAPKWTPPEPPPQADLLIDRSNVSTAALPTWDDSEGTVYLEDGNGNKRAASWSPAGFTVVNNGVTLEQYPPVWNDPPHTHATRYYVDAKGGNDSNSGTSSSSPWKTVAKVNSSKFSPGDQILFKCGQEWNEQLTPPSSGSAGNVIKFGSYETGAKPRIQGADRNLVVESKSNLFFENINFDNATFTSSRKYWGAVTISGINSPAENIWMYGCIVKRSAGTGLLFNQDVDGFWMKDSYIHTSQYYGVGGDDRDQYHNINFTGTEVYNNGISVGSNFGAVVLATGRVWNCDLYNGWGSNIYHDRRTAYANVFHFHDNRIYSNAEDGAGISAKSSANSYRNIIYDTLATGLLHNEPDGFSPTFKDHHNVVYAAAGDGVKVDRTYGRDISGGSLNYYFWNNTIHEINTSYSCFFAITESEDIHLMKVRNNLFAGARYGYNVYENPLGTEDIDYTFIADDVVNEYRLAGVNQTYAAWLARGNDANGTNGLSAGFIDSTNAVLPSRNYGLTAGSAARSVGTDVVPDVTTDVNSWIGINYVPHATSPDCGAYQYLSGKTLNFSKYFLGLQGKNNTAQRFRLWRTSKDENGLRTLTST